MSYSPGQAAAENIERFLDARPGGPAYDLLSQSDGLEIRVSDLRGVLAELAEYKQAVNAILELDGSYGISRQDLLNTAAAHITGLEV